MAPFWALSPQRTVKEEKRMALLHTPRINLTSFSATVCCWTKRWQNWTSHSCLPKLVSLRVAPTSSETGLQHSHHCPYLSILQAAWGPSAFTYYNQCLNTLPEGLKSTILVLTPVLKHAVQRPRDRPAQPLLAAEHYWQLKTSQMPFKTSYISNNLNVSSPLKMYKLAEWIKKQYPIICCLQEIHFICQDKYKLKEMEKDITQMKTKSKQE